MLALTAVLQGLIILALLFAVCFVGDFLIRLAYLGILRWRAARQARKLGPYDWVRVKLYSNGRCLVDIDAAHLAALSELLANRARIETRFPPIAYPTVDRESFFKP